MTITRPARYWLDNLPDVLGNPRDKAIVDEILEIGGKVEQLITTRGGLVRGSSPPESFTLFLGHYRILKMAIQGKDRPSVEEFEYYPRQLNGDIQKGYVAITSEIDDIVRRSGDLLNQTTR